MNTRPGTTARARRASRPWHATRHVRGLPLGRVEAGTSRGARERHCETMRMPTPLRAGHRLRRTAGRVGVGLAAHVVPGVAGIFSGMRSRGGIGDPRRTTTIERKRSSTFWARLRRAVRPRPPMTPRRTSAVRRRRRSARGVYLTVVGARDGDLGEQFWTERSLALFDAPALLADLTADLLGAVFLHHPRRARPAARRRAAPAGVEPA